MPARKTVSTPAVVLVALAGFALGVAGYAFGYAKGTSYAGDDPATCANCHVMTGHLEAWQSSSHHAVATCNGCHTPEGARRYVAKATNGYHHSLAFTTGEFPDVIIARSESRAIVEGRCRACHADMVQAMTAGGDVSCVRCHAAVGHLR